MLKEFSEVGEVLETDFGVTATDIFRSVVGVAKKSEPMNSVLRDILSAIDKI